MLLLSGVLSLIVLIYAVDGWDARGRHFHALFQFQLLGINGAFLTGDIFNLFVFFEVMLIASYGLMLHGSGARRLRAGFQYVAVNLLASTLFLFAVGLIYAVTGTLNMADLAVKVPQVAAGDQALLFTGAMLLFMVFAIKAALAPLHWWLPATYAAASAPVAALFAIMTKVGAYSILRVYSLIFGAEAGAAAHLIDPWIMPAALVTLVVGAIGMLASRTLLDLVAFSIVASMGTLLIAVAPFEAEAAAAALYYLVHTTIAGAVLFLLVDLIAERRGRFLDRLTVAPRIDQWHLLAGLFFAGAIMKVGMPPLSGFLGKLLILDATREAPLANWIWAVILATSLVMLLAFARAGSQLFWKGGGENQPAGTPVRFRFLPVAAIVLLIGASVGLSVLAGPATRHFESTARQMLDPAQYVRAVLEPAPAARLTRN
jgi:multicomponent K+:H+ antiporter subunit D